MDTNEQQKPRRGRPRKEQSEPTSHEVGQVKEKQPEPFMDPHYGDLTPAWVQWFRDNHTEAEWEERYGGRI